MILETICCDDAEKGNWEDERSRQLLSLSSKVTLHSQFVSFLGHRMGANLTLSDSPQLMKNT